MMSREQVGEVLAVFGAALAGGGVLLWLGPGAALGYAGAVLIVLGVMMAATSGRGGQ